VLLAAALAASPLPTLAQGDPLKSPACGEALAGLQSAREARAAGGTVESLRSQAASACLGVAGPPLRPGRIAQAPISVPPPQIDVAPQARLPAGPSLPPPPVDIQRGPSAALCDANGCWSSDGGSHLRQTPNIAGPRGPCITQGAATFCP
jgi:hypothetical protein